MSGFNTQVNQKEIDVWIQDQHTGPFHRYFMTEDKTDIVLTSPASKDDIILNVSAGHGFTGAGERILINYGDYYQQSLILSVSTNAITIEEPIGIDLPITGTQIIRGSIEMNVDGSSTPVNFYCRIGTDANPVDIQHLHVFMVTTTAGDDSKYGGGSAVTNGSFVRYNNGASMNLGTYRKNQDFIQLGASPVDNYTDKSGSGNFSAQFPFDMKHTYGIVFRLNNNSEDLVFTVKDDLTLSTRGLVEHRVVGTGQITLGE